jgi:transglutaminase-like putative cysteine protease
MKLSLTHTLTFSLGTPVRAVQHLLLTPLATPQQKIERWSIAMPGFAEAPTFRDGYGNKAHLVSQVKPEPVIVATITGAVETGDRAGVIGRLEYDPMPALFRRQTEATRADPALIDGLEDGPDRITLFHELMGRVHERSGGRSQAQDGQSQSQGAARPQDSTHALIGAIRGLGIPARYVTGYLLGDDDAASVHAWAELWDENLGWIGFDPTLNLCPAENHIRLASGLDATATMPIRSVPVWGEMPTETVEIQAN